MITSADLAQVPVFAGVEEQERQRLARRAADIHLEPGEWLIREGEDPRFFIVLEGELEGPAASSDAAGPGIRRRNPHLHGHRQHRLHARRHTLPRCTL